MNNGRKRRVLIIEDDPMIAGLLEDMLVEQGCEVAGAASGIEEALHLAAERNFDLAVLDVNLAGRDSYAVADLLARRGIPFLFVTGYGSAGVDRAYAHAAVLQKPFRRADLERVLGDLLG